MKKVSILGFLFFSFVLFQPTVHAENGLTKITDSIYSYVDVKGASPKNSFGANAGIIIGKDFLVAVDSLISAR